MFNLSLLYFIVLCVSVKIFQAKTPVTPEWRAKTSVTPEWRAYSVITASYKIADRRGAHCAVDSNAVYALCARCAINLNAMRRLFIQACTKTTPRLVVCAVRTRCGRATCAIGRHVLNPGHIKAYLLLRRVYAWKIRKIWRFRTASARLWYVFWRRSPLSTGASQSFPCKTFFHDCHDF